MNYLTNYYKNLSEQLQGKINLLESQARELNELRQLNEAPEAYDMADGYGTQANAFSGAYLGQLLGQGNMADVYNYLGQYGMGGVPGGMSALTSGRRSVNRRGVESAGGGAPRGAGSAAFSGANLGQLLGQGNMNAVNNYLANYGNNGAYQAGQALRTSNSPSANRGGYEDAGEGVNPLAGDYNGDGRVDGADLGLALGGGQNPSGVINNWTSPYSAAGPAFLRTNPGVQSQGGGGYEVGGGYGESPTAAGASPAGGGVSRPKVYGSAGGGAPRGGFGVAGPAGGGAPRGGFGVEGPAGGPGGSGRPTSLPALTDLNGDGRIDGGDLGMYMLQYGAVPPGYGQQQTQPSPGQPGGYTPRGIGTYSPSATTRPGAGSRRRQF